MNSTTRNVLIIIVIALLAAALIYKERQIKTQNDVVESKEELYELGLEQTDSLGKRVEKLEARNSELEQLNSKLVRQNKMLRDSVVMLNRRIKVLNQKLKDQTNTMVANRDEIEKLKAESARLTAEVRRLKNQESSNVVKIEELEDKRAKLDSEIGELFVKNNTLEADLLDNVVEREKLNEDYRKKERTLDIINQVKVDFGTISPLNDKDKRARNPKQWHHTLINLSLSYPDSLLVPGEETFVVKIINKDDGNVVSPRESNIGKDAQGIPFAFQSNPVPEIKYVNYQGKEGKNYMVQVFYEKNNKQYPLQQGTQDISFKKQK